MNLFELHREDALTAAGHDAALLDTDAYAAHDLTAYAYDTTAKQHIN